MQGAPTELNAFTKCASLNWRCSVSISDMLMSVKNRSTPFSGGASSIGLQASITVFPARFFAPASVSASAAALPFTASTISSPNAAASANVPTEPPWVLRRPVRQLCRIPAPHLYRVTVFQKPAGQRLRYVARSKHSDLHRPPINGSLDADDERIKKAGPTVPSDRNGLSPSGTKISTLRYARSRDALGLPSR